MSHKNLLWVLIFIFAGIIMVPSIAKAEYPEHGIYIGAYGGYMLKLGDWKLGSEPQVFNTASPLNPQSSALMGLRLGYHFTPRLICEVGGAYLPLESTNDESNTGLKGDIDLYYHLMRGNISPFIGIGIGAFSVLKGGDLGSDFDGQAHATIGLRGLVTPKVALRAEVRDYMVEDYSSADYGQNLEVSAGIDFYMFGVKKKAAPAPAAPAPVSPTLTAYTINDTAYTVGSSISNNKPTFTAGYPGTDTFSVSPALPAGLSINARTGVISGTPTTAAEKTSYTVTLTNGVGTATYPLTIAVSKALAAPTLTAYTAKNPTYTVGSPISNNKPTFTVGYPGTDTFSVSPALPAGLSINSSTGEISGTPTAVSEKASYTVTLTNGVGAATYPLTITVSPAPTAAVVAQFTGTMKGINFNTGTATILPSSSPILDAAVSTLNEYKSLHIRIEGHTDSIGTSESNQKLSEDRANSVKNYLVAKGISEDRIETAGLGDSHPVQSNKTAAGRAANRRIEFSILSQN